MSRAAGAPALVTLTLVGLTLVALPLVAGGCFAPRFADGEIECENDSDCPPSFQCTAFTYSCRSTAHDDPKWVASNAGLTGGSATWVVFDPRNHFVAYASTASAGIFKSTDGGRTWASASRGLGTRRVFAIAVDPADGQRLAAATDAGTYFSSNGAAQWSRVAGFVATAVTRRVIFDSHGILWATSADRHVYRSFGNPPELNDEVGFDDNINDIAFDESNNGYVGLNRASVPIPPVPPPGGVWFNDATKISWTKSAMVDDDIYRIWTAGHTVFLAGQSGLWRGSGGSFAKLDPGLPAGTIQALGGSLGAVVYAALPSANGLVLYKSSDGGDSFARNGAGISAAQAITFAPIAVEPTDANIAIWPSSGDGLYRTENGSDWALANDGMSGWPVTSLLVDPTQPSVVMAAVNISDTHGDFWRSSDGGAHWQRGDRVLGTLSAGSLAVSGSRLLRVGDSGISWSEDHGASWTAASADFVYGLAVAPSAPETIYAPGAVSVQLSTDGGKSWGKSGAITGADVVVVDPANPAIAYAGTADAVYRTSDTGASWSLAANGLPHLAVLSLAASGRVLLVGTENGIYRSVDAASSWTLAAGTVGLRVTSMVASARNPDRLYASAPNGGVFQSIDGGANWAAMNDGLDDPFVNVIAVDPSQPAMLLAGTSGLGVVRTTR